MSHKSPAMIRGSIFPLQLFPLGQLRSKSGADFSAGADEGLLRALTA